MVTITVSRAWAISTKAALVDESCSHCGNMTIAMLWSRYLLVKGGSIPLAMPRSSSSVSLQRRATSAHGQGDLRITVRASPSSASPQHWRPPPSPECLGLDDWFLGAQADCRQPPLVPFFPEVHEEVTRSWRAPFSA